MAFALMVSCGKREGAESSSRPLGPSAAPTVEEAVTHDVPQDVPDMSNVAGVVAALLSLETSMDNKPSPFAIKEALMRLSERNGMTFGEGVRQVYDAATEDASEAQVKRKGKYLAGIGLGDQDLLLSMLAASAPGPMLESMGGVALGSAFRDKGYDLEAVYKAMPESNSRVYIASTWVSRTSSNDGFAGALGVLDSLETKNERMLGFNSMLRVLRMRLREGRPVHDEEISALRERASEFGYEDWVDEVSQSNR